MFYTFESINRLARIFRELPVDVSEELRGWKWGEYPLLHPSSVRLGVSDIANGFCNNGRFVYLKYVLKVKGSPLSERVEAGAFIHKTFSEVIRLAKRVIYSCEDLGRCEFRESLERYKERSFNKLRKGLKMLDEGKARRIFDQLWEYGANTYASAFVKVRSLSRHLGVDGAAALIVPLTTEYPIDGSLVGLTKAIRIDALLPPSTLIELKTREVKPIYDVALAAYAIAFESQYEIPVNYALLVNLRFDRNYNSFKVYERPVPIGDALRQRFVELRDELTRIVEEGTDPGLPEECDPECPYLRYCRGEGDGG